MPYGTVNLARGVSPSETPVTCTAGVGTFILEFAALSRLTGDPQFETAARHALLALWDTRSEIGLVPSLCLPTTRLSACLSVSLSTGPLGHPLRDRPSACLSVILSVCLSTTCMSLLTVCLSTTCLSLLYVCLH